MKFTDEQAAIVRGGGVGVIPTDTLYGIVANAADRNAVERVYSIKERDNSKPVLILIGSVNDLSIFGVDKSGENEQIIEQFWPGTNTLLFEYRTDGIDYLHRQYPKLAFRLPADEVLRGFLTKTGPIIAPSANPEGEAPASTIDEAQGYFGDHVDFYVDGGTLQGSPSRLIEIVDGNLNYLR